MDPKSQSNMNKSAKGAKTLATASEKRRRSVFIYPLMPGDVSHPKITDQMFKCLCLTFRFIGTPGGVKKGQLELRYATKAGSDGAMSEFRGLKIDGRIMKVFNYRTLHDNFDSIPIDRVLSQWRRNELVRKKEEDELTSVFVNNLPPQTTFKLLHHLVSSAVKYKLPLANKGLSEGYAIVDFLTEREAEMTIDNLKGIMLNCQRISLGIIPRSNTHKVMREVNLDPSKVVKNPRIPAPEEESALKRKSEDMNGEQPAKKPYPDPGKAPQSKLVVGSLSPDMTAPTIQSFFLTKGIQLKAVLVVKNKLCANITLEKIEDYDKAILLNGTEFKGKTLTVSPVLPPLKLYLHGLASYVTPDAIRGRFKWKNITIKNVIDSTPHRSVVVDQADYTKALAMGALKISGHMVTIRETDRTQPNATQPTEPPTMSPAPQTVDPMSLATCTLCGQKGHILSDCGKLKSEKASAPVRLYIGGLTPDTKPLHIRKFYEGKGIKVTDINKEANKLFAFITLEHREDYVRAAALQKEFLASLAQKTTHVDTAHGDATAFAEKVLKAVEANKVKEDEFTDKEKVTPIQLRRAGLAKSIEKPLSIVQGERVQTFYVGGLAKDAVADDTRKFFAEQGVELQNVQKETTKMFGFIVVESRADVLEAVNRVKATHPNITIRPANNRPGLALPIKRVDRPCQFYKQGSCFKGLSCGYLHEDGSAPGPPKKICGFFQRGKCTFGDSCKFSHDLMPLRPDDEPPASGAQGRSGSPPPQQRNMKPTRFSDGDTPPRKDLPRDVRAMIQDELEQLKSGSMVDAERLSVLVARLRELDEKPNEPTRFDDSRSRNDDRGFDNRRPGFDERASRFNDDLSRFFNRDSPVNGRQSPRNDRHSPRNDRHSPRNDRHSPVPMDLESGDDSDRGRGRGRRGQSPVQDSPRSDELMIDEEEDGRAIDMNTVRSIEHMLAQWD